MNCYKFTIQGKVFYVVAETTFKAIDCLFEKYDLGWFDLITGDDVEKLDENEMIAMRVKDDKGRFIAFLPDYLLTAKESVINTKQL